MPMENWRSEETECIEGAESHWFGTCTEQMLLRRMCSAGIGNSKIYESSFPSCSKFWFASICLLIFLIYCVRNLFRSAVQLQIVEMMRSFKFDSIFSTTFCLWFCQVSFVQVPFLFQGGFTSELFPIWKQNDEVGIFGDRYLQVLLSFWTKYIVEIIIQIWQSQLRKSAN